MSETNRKPFKRKLKRDELIAMANDSNDSEDEKDVENFDAGDSFSKEAALQAQKDDEENCKYFCSIMFAILAVFKSLFYCK